MVLGFLFALTFLFTVIVVAVWLLLPVVSQASERARVERETHEASWRIHQRANQAFGEMLDAARRPDDTEGRP